MDQVCDGISAMVPREKMSDMAKLRRDTYAITPDAPFIQQEFGFYGIARQQLTGGAHS